MKILYVTVPYWLLTAELVGTCTVGMSGMRKFPYRYTGKNIPVIPVYRYFGLVKSWVLLDIQNYEMDEKSQNIEL